MNLLDIMEGRAPAVPPPAAQEVGPLTYADGCVRRDAWVRLRGGDRVGFVLIEVVRGTGRCCVMWAPGDCSWHLAGELEAAPAPELHRHEWAPGEQRDGLEHRLVWTCACGAVRGRA